MTSSDDPLFLDEQCTVAFTELTVSSGLTQAEIEDLISFGVLEPVGMPAGVPSAERQFSANCISTVRAAARLRDGFELSGSGLAVALIYLERIRQLEAELAEVRCRLL